MAIEIEKKYRLDAARYERLLSALEEIGAEYQGEDFEENTLYRGGVLDEKSAVLRVRKIGARTILTYKRRIQNEFDVKRQIEHETEIASAEEIENIIENLGFVASVIYEKRRRTWRFREVEIVLDELPFGLFMEIEGSSVTAIAEAEMFLAAEDFEVEHETYPRLTAKYGRKNGELVEARFAG
ncbi:MAG: class IV adenylate cyclase [Acidobacteriota bacterium]|nr:class IV adenylate cyclase [Acidobacteriota bacterium]